MRHAQVDSIFAVPYMMPAAVRLVLCQTFLSSPKNKNVRQERGDVLYSPTYQQSKNNPSANALHLHGTVSAKYGGAAADETPTPNPIANRAAMDMAIF